MSCRNGSRGVTLFELCFGLALVALLAGLAAPGFRASVRSAAVRSATYELLTGLQQARGHAIVAARSTLLCLSDLSGNCLAGTAPASAWSVSAESAVGPLDARPLPAGIELHATRSPLRFWPDSLAASTGTLTICDARGIAAPRAIVLSQSGRARVRSAVPADCR
jgi:type IV fimbrial biogenesis protein FimT